MNNQEFVYEKAINWVRKNTVDDGIIVDTKNKVIYPEVTGYYIPTLLNVGEKDLAIRYAKKMCSIQKPNGAWFDHDDETPFIFDTCQILKGLVSIRSIMPEVDENIIKGIDWVFSNLSEDGHLIQPNRDVWGGDDTHCNDLIHIYCMSPIIEAGTVLNRPDYVEKANKVLDYYIDHYRDRIINYSLFAHFYAYVIEGLIDCGRTEIAREAMRNFEKYRNDSGKICAYNDVDWVCSTATFQFAIIYYKLGDKRKGDIAYNYMCSLQNSTGGWYGCYTKSKVDEIKYRLLRKLNKSRDLYYRNAEISWANKFFLDAYYIQSLS